MAQVFQARAFSPARTSTSSDFAILSREPPQKTCNAGMLLRADARKLATTGLEILLARLQRSRHAVVVFFAHFISVFSYFFRPHGLQASTHARKQASKHASTQASKQAQTRKQLSKQARKLGVGGKQARKQASKEGRKGGSIMLQSPRNLLKPIK